MKNLIILIIFAIALQSCKNKTEKKKIEEVKSKPTIEIQNKDTIPETLKDTFIFDSYNNYTDYEMLIAKKGKSLYRFINYNNKDRSLLKGDKCEIFWKKDTIYIAGEGDKPEIADWITSIRKISSGNVSKFRNTYKNELKYRINEDIQYTEDYLKEIYLITEYYIANSKSELIKQAIQSKKQIEYSLENRTEKDKDYHVIGIGYTLEHHFIIMQWIYIDKETMQVYEYDLPNEKLVVFE